MTSNLAAVAAAAVEEEDEDEDEEDDRRLITRPESYCRKCHIQVSLKVLRVEV